MSEAQHKRFSLTSIFNHKQHSVEGTPTQSPNYSKHRKSKSDSRKLLKSLYDKNVSQKSFTTSDNFIHLSALKEIVGVGLSDEEKTRSAMEYIKMIFSNPSDVSITTSFHGLCPNKRFISKESQYYVLLMALINSHNKMYDVWSSLELPVECWYQQNNSFNVIDNCYLNGEYHVEVNNNSCSKITDLCNYEIICVDDDFTFFKQFFYKNKNITIHLFIQNNIILCHQHSQNYQLVMVFRSNGIKRFIIPNDEDVISWYMQKTHITSKPIQYKGLTLQDQLVQFEYKSITISYKFGVLYAGPGQVTEKDMYSDNNPSAAFWKFMNLIADRKKQKNWDRFAGGLDVVHETTGDYFYFTQYEEMGYELLFHVAPLLPESNEQQLDRKRHIGNDIVVIIFKEMANENDRFDPTLISSHFNHVFIIISPLVTGDDNNSYRVNIVCKCEVLPFPPFVEEKWYPHDLSFKNFVHRKLINAERACLKGGVFINNSEKSSNQIIHNIIQSC
ncbi:Palmitoyltransferase [Entamoeba marina]